MNIKSVLHVIIIGLTVLYGPREVYAQYTTAGIDIEEPKVVEVKEDMELVISLDKKDWMYTVGERPIFTVKLLEDNVPVRNKNVEVSYIIPSGVHKIYSSQRIKTYGWLKESLLNSDGL